jgi:hypothetical protein
MNCYRPGIHVPVIRPAPEKPAHWTSPLSPRCPTRFRLLDFQHYLPQGRLPGSFADSRKAYFFSVKAIIMYDILKIIKAGIVSK